MKKLVIALAIVIMIAGGAVATLKTMQIGIFAPQEGAVEEVKPAEPSKFIDMDPLVIPIYQGNRVVSVIQIHLKLEALGDDNEKVVKHLLPRLHDAFLRDLYDYIPRLMRTGKKVDLVTIKSRLNLVGKRVVKGGQLENILIQSMVDNPSGGK